MPWRIGSRIRGKSAFSQLIQACRTRWGLQGCILSTQEPSPAPQALATTFSFPSSDRIQVTLCGDPPHAAVVLVLRTSWWSWTRGAARAERGAVRPGQLSSGCFLIDSLQPAASDWETHLGTRSRRYRSAFRRSGGGSPWIALSVLVGQGERRREKSTNSNQAPRWFFKCPSWSDQFR